MRVFLADQPGPPGALCAREFPIPEPQYGQVRVRVAYTTLNPLDVLIRQGRVTWMRRAWPFVPGLEFSGRIDRVGAGVDTKWLGKAVVSSADFGGAAEYVVTAVAKVTPLVERLGWVTGTAWRVPTLAAWYLLDRAAKVKPGEWVVVHSAAGAVGAMAVQIAKEMGARVIGLAGGAAKIAYARGFGADHVVDYRAPGWPAEVKRLTGEGADLIVDGNGGEIALKNNQAIAPQGRIFYIGATSGVPAPQVPPQLLIARSISVGGFNLNSIPEAIIAADEPRLATKLAEKRWRFPLGEIADLSALPDFHARFEARTLMGRTIFKVAGDL
jgi:NADPH2:quinone reductase